MSPNTDSPEREVFCGYCGERLPDLGEGAWGSCPRCRRVFGERRRRRPPPPPLEVGREGRALPSGPPLRDPVLAALFSAVLPGLGQVYNLQFLKGMFVFLTCWLVVPYFLGILDAYLTAERSNRAWQTVTVKRG